MSNWPQSFFPPLDLTLERFIDFEESDFILLMSIIASLAAEGKMDEDLLSVDLTATGNASATEADFGASPLPEEEEENTSVFISYWID